MFKKILGVIVDLIGFGGVLAMTYGVYSIHNESGFIFGGLMALVFAILAGRK